MGDIGNIEPRLCAIIPVAVWQCCRCKAIADLRGEVVGVFAVVVIVLEIETTISLFNGDLVVVGCTSLFLCIIGDTAVDMPDDEARSIAGECFAAVDVFAPFYNKHLAGVCGVAVDNRRKIVVGKSDLAAACDV